MSERRASLHRLTGPPGSALATVLDGGSHVLGHLRPLHASFPVTIVDVSGPENVIENAGKGLPDGAARPEAIAVRLRRAGVRLEWGEPEEVDTTTSFLQLCRARGASSVEMVQVDPSLLSELQIGSWFHAGAQLRLLRRTLYTASGLLRFMPRTAALRLLADLAFWSGVRDAASPAEWKRWTRSSYVVLLYHRVAGEQNAGEERLDVAPARFDAHLRLLRRLRFQPVGPDELLSFHQEPVSTLASRRYVLTFDDAYRDAARALAGRGDHLPEMFVPTDWVGQAPPWAGGGDAVLADWDQLRALTQDGVALGSHTRHHPVLPELTPPELDDELLGSRRTLEHELGEALPFLAYPHGRYDHAVRAAAARAGYAVAYTTDPGRNGSGTDPLGLRRISVKDWDSRLSFLWKAVTGEQLPAFWERRRQRRHRRHKRR